MTAADVLALHTELDRLGIPIWIDGGWCVDALLGKQTRPHSDLDIALEQRHVGRAQQWLEARGYREVKRDSEWNFEMADTAGRKVDFHAFVLNDAGDVVDGVQYPNGSLTGVGKIGSHSVRCISPEFMMKFHSGYRPRETDVQDVRALQKKFRIPLPPEYETARTSQSTWYEPALRVTAYFARYSLPWYIAGGWAVDLFLGRQTRPHHDIEVAVFRRDQRLLRHDFKDWAWSKVVPESQGSVKTVWDEQEWLELPVRELHACGSKGELVEVLLQESDAKAWRFRREPTVSLPLSDLGLRSQLGIPILRPEVVLLYKAKSPGPKDQADFSALLPALGDAQTAWLGEALDRCHPGHPWRARLNLRM